MHKSRVVLYGKPGCHLCEDMHDLVDEALEGTGVSATTVDITSDLELFIRFQHDVPVLEIDGREVARHRVSVAALGAALAGAGIVAPPIDVDAIGRPRQNGGPA